MQINISITAFASVLSNFETSHSLVSFFHGVGILSFNEVQLINLDHASAALSKRSSPNLESSTFPPMLFSKSFIVLFKSVKQFKFHKR